MPIRFILPLRHISKIVNRAESFLLLMGMSVIYGRSHFLFQFQHWRCYFVLCLLCVLCGSNFLVLGAGTQESGTIMLDKYRIDEYESTL